MGEPAAAQPVGGGAVVAHGPGGYVNRAIGIGPSVTEADLDAIGSFFSTRDLPPSIQVSSHADADTLVRLVARGYAPQWFRSVFAAPLPLIALSKGFEILPVDDSLTNLWMETLAAGNEIVDPVARASSDEFATAAHRAAGSHDFLAFVEGEPAACGSLQVIGEVGWLGGAATRPSHRGRGLQAALLTHRTTAAAAHLGCTAVAATALPGGTSARNLVRAGLSLVDVQLVLTA